MLSQVSISDRMDTKIIGRNVIYLKETDSTNEYAKRVAGDVSHGTLVVADCQSSGKGRLGRKWSSPHETAIFMTLILKDIPEPEKASMVTIVAAMSVSDALKESVSGAFIKWPNDIVINGRKVCGILTETKSSGRKSQYVIVGIGINVNNEKFPEDIDGVATSLYRETNMKHDRAEIICRVMKYFEKYYNVFLECGDLKALVDDYNKSLANRDNLVEITAKEGTYRAECSGIDQWGRLIVKRKDTGSTEKIMSGEVSVRGVYGYV